MTTNTHLHACQKLNTPKNNNLLRILAMWYVASNKSHHVCIPIWVRIFAVACVSLYLFDNSDLQSESHFSDAYFAYSCFHIYAIFTIFVMLKFCPVLTITNTISLILWWLMQYFISISLKTGACKTCCFSSFTITHELWCTTKCGELVTNVESGSYERCTIHVKMVCGSQDFNMILIIAILSLLILIFSLPTLSLSYFHIHTNINIQFCLNLYVRLVHI